MTTIWTRAGFGPWETRTIGANLLCRSREQRPLWICAQCRSTNGSVHKPLKWGRRTYGSTGGDRQYVARKGHRDRLLDRRTIIGSRRVGTVASPTNGTEDIENDTDWGYGQHGLRTTEAELEGDKANALDRRYWEQMNEIGGEHKVQDEIDNTDELANDDRADTAGVSASVSNDDTLDDAFIGRPVDRDWVRAEMEQALMHRNPDRMLRVLRWVTNDPACLESIPYTTFSEILQLLRPENLVGEMIEIHQGLSYAVVVRNGIKPLRKIVHDYLDLILDLINKRRDTGRSLALEDYQALLSIARVTGSDSVAKGIWRAMKQDDHWPDLACYNQYLGSFVENDKFAAHRHKTRATEYNMMQRIKPRPYFRYSNYRVMDGGIKTLVLSIFDEMLKRGIVADEESFCSVINASAREGDVKGFEQILRRVWGVNAAAISNFTGAGREPEPEVSVSPGTPLYPTNRLLWTVVHAYSINNDTPGALRMIDYLMRHFNIETEVNVWEELFRWTFVMAADRGENHGNRVLPTESLTNLWNTITQAPYNVKPTMPMYNCLVKNSSISGTFMDMLTRMNEGLQLALQVRSRCAEAWQNLQMATSQDAPQLKPIDTLQREFDEADLERLRNHQFLTRWLRLAQYALARRSPLDFDGEWSTQVFPKLLVSQWSEFTGAKVEYETPTGLVQLKVHERTDMLGSAKKERRRRMEIVDGTMSSNQRVLGKDWARSQPYTTRRLDAYERSKFRIGAI